MACDHGLLVGRDHPGAAREPGAEITQSARPRTVRLLVALQRLGFAQEAAATVEGGVEAGHLRHAGKQPREVGL